LCTNSASGAGELRAEPVELLGLAREPRVHDQRVEPDQPPAGGLEAPAVVADHGQKGLATFFRRRLRWRRADRGRIVADVVIAGQIEAVDGKRCMQRFCEFEIVAAGRRVEGEVAGVDDKVRPRRVDMLAHAMEILGERRIAAGEVGIGNLRQSKFAHAAFLFRRDHIGRQASES
jgi:hypothetical protein